MPSPTKVDTLLRAIDGFDGCPTVKAALHLAPGSVAKMTHAGIPWLLHIRELTGGEVHFWPFDGWEIPAGRSAIVETWPALWNKKFPRQDRTAEEQNAYAISTWLRQTDRAGDLPKFLNPPLLPSERTIAEIEGWMLGVM